MDHTMRDMMKAQNMFLLATGLQRIPKQLHLISCLAA